ncbi:type II toxin-antitoxin system HipA family toxin [Glutamicibacter sp. NPDC087344]|uniref:type II toxin-antitoxin system HipA family toxin n=1 Tax=Glutamicibacter sp. NPDC087344 TaxID=3363994 RepID=UPI0038258F51
MPFEHVEVIEVKAWGQTIGAINRGKIRNAFTFEFAPGLDGKASFFPLSMNPTRQKRLFSFPGLSTETWSELPPGIADSLPDKFGNTIINAEMARRGADPTKVSVLDRLAYTGRRAMGALEFQPANSPLMPHPTALDLSDLVVKARQAVAGTLANDVESEAALAQILAVGSSAGGARAKAVVNLNPVTNELTPGQEPSADAESWLLKFDGVQDEKLGDGKAFGRIEYAYSLMARAAGINMPKTRLHKENDRAHFMIKRFDRPGGTRKLHMQSLCAMKLLDFNLVGTHDYSQFLQTIDQLNLGDQAKNEAFRRMVFNYAAWNCDDHTKNQSFLMDERGQWSLAPAYDVTFSYRADSKWVDQHLMGVNGKFLHVTAEEMYRFGEQHGVRGYRSIVSEVNDAVDNWSDYANSAEVDTIDRRPIEERIGRLI